MQRYLEERMVDEMEYKLTYNAFKEALKQNKLLGLKCNQCGAYTAPPKKVCMECASEDMEIVELNGKGEIQTFTVINVPPEGFEAPYMVALVKLDEGPWIMGNVIGIDLDKATMDLMGRKVEMSDSKIHPGDKFSAGEKVALVFALEA